MVSPYPGQLTEEQKVYNYRHSCGRRLIENAFGLQLFYISINACVENIEKYVKYAIALHSYLRQGETHYIVLKVLLCWL